MDGEDGATPAKTKKTGLTFMGYKDTKGTTTRFLFFKYFFEYHFQQAPVRLWFDLLVLSLNQTQVRKYL